MFIFSTNFTQLLAEDNSNGSVFSKIYEGGIWGKDTNGIGTSGSGSSPHNAKIYIDFLRNFLKKNEITSVVDVGCGDWQLAKVIDWAGIEYLGIDVVESIIEKNVKNFSSENISFLLADAVDYDLPSADLLICKDVLQHLTFKDIFAIIPQFSKFKYCLIINDVDLKECTYTNTDIERGDFRPLNLSAPPFNMDGKTIFVFNCPNGETKQVFLIKNGYEPSLSSTNPFIIDYPEKTTLTLADYLEINEKLKSIDITADLKEYYYENCNECPELMSETDFLDRCTRALRGDFLREDKNLLPKKKLTKINKGGDICIVCSIPYRSNYLKLLNNQIKLLKKVGFKGHHLSFCGAYPTPTGKETRYIGVPYAFKIFAMLEAQKLGFKKVVWLDAAYLPLRNPTSLFKRLEQVGGIFTTLPKNGFGRDRCPIQTSRALKDLTGVDVTKDTDYVVAAIIALQMDHPLTKQFIHEYYQMVCLGYPFLSCTPEEQVFTAILGQEKFSEWKNYNMSRKSPLRLNKKLLEYTKKNAEKNHSYFFYHPH